MWRFARSGYSVCFEAPIVIEPEKTIDPGCPRFRTDLHWFLQNVENLVIHNGSRNRPLAFSHVEWGIAVLVPLEEFYYMIMGIQYPGKSKVAVPFFHVRYFTSRSHFSTFDKLLSKLKNGFLTRICQKKGGVFLMAAPLHKYHG